MRSFLFCLAALTIGLMLVPSAAAAEETDAEDPDVIFADSFEKAELAEGWSWLRENPEAWRIRDGGLEIRAEPGDAHSVKNALLRPAPDRSQGAFAVEVTVSNLTPPTEQYEQLGITWYVDGNPVFKLVKERIDGDMWIIPGRKPIENVPIRLRLIIRGDQWTAQYRPEVKPEADAAQADKPEFLTAGEGKLPEPKNDQVSLQCYHGPTDAEHWMRFEDFRIIRWEE